MTPTPPCRLTVRLLVSEFELASVPRFVNHLCARALFSPTANSVRSSSSEEFTVAEFRRREKERASEFRFQVDSTPSLPRSFHLPRVFSVVYVISSNPSAFPLPPPKRIISSSSSSRPAAAKANARRRLGARTLRRH